MSHLAVVGQLLINTLFVECVMLFNSYEFIFLFLPISLLVLYATKKLDLNRLSIFWVVIISVFFYAYRDFYNIILLIFSIIFNYIVGGLIAKRKDRKYLLILGILTNIVLLSYYKYTNFIIGNLNAVSSYNFDLLDISLPIAISFFTFQQIAYLVDSYQGKVDEHDFAKYIIFVSFFPQLIAGPIVHHNQIFSQSREKSFLSFNSSNLIIGISIFSIGLFKKVVLADSSAHYANLIFNSAENAQSATLIEYWIGALCYTFQIYFDFSGYSDMAIGLARMFGVILPENFYSPYKSSSIIDFWRRWHITLSRFLRDYIYIPIGGARSGVSRKFVNIFITMLIGGLWHGAGWTFVAWGAIHALYITINHAWRSFFREHNLRFPILKPINVAITFIAVVIAWVFFRADSFDASLAIIHGMFDLNGWAGLNGLILNTASLYKSICWIFIGMFVAFVLPNTQEIFQKYQVVYEGVRLKNNKFFVYSVSSRWGAIIGLFLLLSLIVMQTEISTFIYFEF